MKNDTPRSSESSTRMQLLIRSGGMTSDAAVTGAPACARTAFAPIARRSVLFPDMFEPVTKRNRPTGPTSTSLATAWSLGSSGCASSAAW